MGWFLLVLAAFSLFASLVFLWLVCLNLGRMIAKLNQTIKTREAEIAALKTDLNNSNHAYTGLLNEAFRVSKN